MPVAYTVRALFAALIIVSKYIVCLWFAGLLSNAIQILNLIPSQTSGCWSRWERCQTLQPSRVHQLTIVTDPPVRPRLEPQVGPLLAVQAGPKLVLQAVPMLVRPMRLELLLGPVPELWLNPAPRLLLELLLVREPAWPQLARAAGRSTSASFLG